MLSQLVTVISISN